MSASTLCLCVLRQAKTHAQAGTRIEKNRSWTARVFIADQTSIKQQFGLPSVGKERLRGAAARQQNPPRHPVGRRAPGCWANPGDVLLEEIDLHLFSIVVAETAALLLPEAVLSYSAGSFFQADILLHRAS